MKKMMCVLLAISSIFGFSFDKQTDLSADLMAQVSLIKATMPNVASIGVMVGPNDLDKVKESIAKAQSELGLKIVTVSVKDVRQKVGQYLRLAANGVVKNHGVQALIFVNGQDSITKNPLGIKMTSSGLSQSKVPVFTANEKGHSLGCLGQFNFDGSQWVVLIDSKTASKLEITLPSDVNGVILN